MTAARGFLHRRGKKAPLDGRRRGRRTGLRLTALAGAVTVLAMLPVTVHAAPWPGHPDRSLVRHTVRPGDTATGLAVRYHAWTDELIRLNRLGPKARLYRGQVLRIPVVVSAARAARAEKAGKAAQVSAPKKSAPTKAKGPRAAKHGKKRPPLLVHTGTPRPKGWLHHRMSRGEVRKLVSRMAARYDVPRVMALAIAWQESGWQQHRVSSAGALGVMQVMPGTGRWMRQYAGRPLKLRDTHDNIQAGVLTLKVLRRETREDRNAIAAYYQGLGAVRRHGLYEETERYLANVRAHQRRIIRSGSPH